MKKTLLILCACLFGALNGVKAWTSVVPYDGRTYYLYNIGTNAYWYGTNSTYTTTAEIGNATPITVESGHKLAFQYNGTTYRIYQDAGTGKQNNQSGVNFTFQGDTNGYRLESKNTTGSGNDYTRDMQAGGSFPRVSYHEGNVTWQFISVYEVNSNTPNICASEAEASYVSAANGWEKVTSVEMLKANPEDYFFAIFCANYPGLMVRTNAAEGQGYYMNSTNPLNSSAYLFGIENYRYNNEDYFVMKAENTGGYYHPVNGAAYDLFAPSSKTKDETCRLTFEYANNAWNIKTWAVADNGSYWGLWFRSNDYKDGEKMAGNRISDQKGSFLIYRIPKYRLDMTTRVVNPKAESSTNGWSDDTEYLGGETNTGFDGVVGIFQLADWWGSSWTKTATQTISSLPNGYYQIQVAGQVSETNTTLTLTANGVSNQFRATGTTGGTILADGTEVVSGGVGGWHYSRVQAQVTDGNLTISLRGEADAQYRWTNFDNVSLTYIASSLPESLTAVSGKMNADVKTAQQNAVDAYNSSKTVANYIAAQDAIAAAEASIEAYANALTYLNKVKELLATTNFYTTTAYNNVYGNYKAAYDANTLNDATALSLNYKVASHVDNQRYNNNTANDLLIPGWTIGGGDASTSELGFYINTWSNEGNTDGSNVTTPFYEYWTNEGSALAATDLVASISGYKPNTSYRISALVRVQQQKDQSKAADDLTFKVGSGAVVNAADGTQSSNASYTSMYYKTVIATGTSDAEGNLSVTFSVKEGNHLSWVAFKNIIVEELASNREANLLFNADFEKPYTVYVSSGVSNDRAIYVPNGWTINGTFDVNDMTILNSGDKSSDNFTGITALSSGGNNTFLYRGKWGTETSFDVFQNISLPAGTYKLSCDAWKSGLGGDGVIFVGSNTASLSDNEASWRPLSLEFTLNEATSLNVGFRVTHTSQNEDAKFIGFDNFALYTVNKVDESETYTPVNKVAHSVIVKRTIKEGVNTVVFPFSMTQEEVEAYFGAGSVVYQLSSYENETIHFTTKEGISANEPCLVKATSTTNSAADYELTDRTLVSGTPERVGKNVTMTGTYNAVEAIARGNYIVKDDMLYVVDSDNVKMRNTRAYITLGTTNQARIAIKFDDDDATAISFAEQWGGAERKQLNDGKYLENGKIIIVKNGVKYGTNGQKLN